METIKVNTNNIRLDLFLVEESIYPSRSVSVKNIENNNVKVNGEFVKKNYKLQQNDVIEYCPYIKDDKIVGNNIPLDIVYEDDDLIVINKQAGLVCHPCTGHMHDTLVNALINYCGVENLSKVQGSERPGIVHRLDADTSGLMLVAKNDDIAINLMEQIKKREVDRHYLALIYGSIKQNTGKIDTPILRVIDSHNRPRMAVKDRYKAKQAITTFKTLTRYIDFRSVNSNYSYSFSLLDCKLYTGRTHQIRCHMEFIGSPVVGDLLYTHNAPKTFDAKRDLNLNRQFLHSYKIRFTHPKTNKEMAFEIDLPEDLSKVLNLLDEYKQD